MSANVFAVTRSSSAMETVIAGLGLRFEALLFEIRISQSVRSPVRPPKLGSDVTVSKYNFAKQMPASPHGELAPPPLHVDRHTAFDRPGATAHSYCDADPLWGKVHGVGPPHRLDIRANARQQGAVRTKSRCGLLPGFATAAKSVWRLRSSARHHPCRQRLSSKSADRVLQPHPSTASARLGVATVWFLLS